jgi:CBS domain-containing protein
MEASGYLQYGGGVDPSSEDVEEWLRTWRTTCARDLIDMRVVPVDADTSVEDACELLLTENTGCLAVRGSTTSDGSSNHIAGLYAGLFDYADVNAFLTLAATQHTLLPEDLRGNPRVNDIVTAAKAGQVPVHLVSNLSDKNPIEILPYNATLVSLLEVFARGTHRTLIKSSVESEDFLGMVSDRRLLAWFDAYAKEIPSFKKYLSNPIQSLSLPSLNLNDAVVSAYSSATILDAMKLMSEQGVSSVAVLEETNGSLLSAVSVTDVGKVCSYLPYIQY